MADLTNSYTIWDVCENCLKGFYRIRASDWDEASSRMGLFLVCDRCTNLAFIGGKENGKEKKDLKNLGCSEMVPNDDVDRYIATSEEFAAALTGPKRKWSNMHYRYRPIATGLPQNTVMLAVVAEKTRQ